jgi:hypothetical protein
VGEIYHEKRGVAKEEWNIDSPFHGILNRQHMLFRTPYQWYFDRCPLNTKFLLALSCESSISNLLSMVFQYTIAVGEIYHEKRGVQYSIAVALDSQLKTRKRLIF